MFLKSQLQWLYLISRPCAFFTRKTANRPYAFTIKSTFCLCTIVTKLLSVTESRGMLDYTNRQRSLEQGCNEVRWHPGQKASLAPPCSNGGLSEANVLYWRTCDIFGPFRRPPQSFGTPIVIPRPGSYPPLPPRYAPGLEQSQKDSATVTIMLVSSQQQCWPQNDNKNDKKTFWIFWARA